MNNDIFVMSEAIRQWFSQVIQFIVTYMHHTDLNELKTRDWTVNQHKTYKNNHCIYSIYQDTKTSRQTLLTH